MAFALKGGLTAVEAQDVVQETMISVAKHMPTFEYDPAIGSFKTWLLNIDPLAHHRPAPPPPCVWRGDAAKASINPRTG